MTRRVHVVGAGLAGLAAAERLSARPDLCVVVHEATAQAGGRCRSFFDARLDRTIDVGSHLILSGNRATLDYARRVGGAAGLETAAEAAFPFVDLATGARWTVRAPDAPPGARAGDLLDALRLLLAPGRGTVAARVRRRGPLWDRFWEPLAMACLNAPPERASAALLRSVLVRSVLRGAGASRPVFAPRGLGAALVDPALATLRGRGVDVRFRAALTSLRLEGGRARALGFAGGETVPLGPDDAVILATPAAALAPLGLAPPVGGGGAAILNAHFRLAPAAAAAVPPLLGVLSGEVQWLFRRGDVVSATVSAAEARAVWALPNPQALARLWEETARALGLSAPPLAARLLRARAATPAQDPGAVARRLPARTMAANVLRAGDHVAGPLPATIEAAVTSGRAAARLVAR